MLILERNPGESIRLKTPGRGNTVIAVEAVEPANRLVRMTIAGHRRELYLNARYRWREITIMVTGITAFGCHIGIEAPASIDIVRNEVDDGAHHAVKSTRRREIGPR